MPGIMVDGGVAGEGREVSSELSSTLMKGNLTVMRSPGVAFSPKSSPSDALVLPLEDCVDTSIDRLYDNVCEMESSSDDGSPSIRTFGSDGDESRIDSELRHLVGGVMEAVEIIEEEHRVENGAVESENGMLSDGKIEKAEKTMSPSKSSVSSKKSKRLPRTQLESDASIKSSPMNKESPNGDKSVTKRPTRLGRTKKPKNNGLGDGIGDASDEGSVNPDLGAFLLKHARDLISSDNHRRALKYALRAAKVFERCEGGKSSLDLAMSLHVIAAIYCNLGQYSQAIPLLEKSLEIPVVEEGKDHALAKFSAYMQLGDTYAMLGQLESSIKCYTSGLQIQKQTLGDLDPRVGETCRYLAEALVQALQFDEAERLCRTALDILKENGLPASLEEIAGRRLMGLICETKGDHEGALEHLVLASMGMVANGQEIEVATVDCSIGDIYLSLTRYDEAVFAYEKALGVFKSTRGENHPTVASVFVRLADLHNKIGKLRESKSYCENALKIYSKPIPGTTPDDIATGLTNISAIYESMDEHDEAIGLLKKALKIYKNAPGQQSTIAGIEAQIGVLYYITGNYGDSYASFKNAIAKLRACGEKKSAFFGIALNQMGLTCVQRFAINEAADLFEEARNILEQEYGPYHLDTLGVYSNLAGIYDAMGRLDEAIEILEYVVRIREEKLGTANPEVDDEKRRLAELLKEAGRVRNRKGKSLEALLDTGSYTVNNEAIAV